MKKEIVAKGMMIVLGFACGSASYAQGRLPVSIPDCLDANGNVLPIDDAQAVDFKTSTANGDTSRAHVIGPILKVLPNANGHNHFEISIGDATGDLIEVIYNMSFGALPTLQTGMQVEVCGDFINAYAPEHGYPASPAGALIHWIHKSTSHHAAGFTVVNGVLYGQGNGSGS